MNKVFSKKLIFLPAAYLVWRLAWLFSLWVFPLPTAYLEKDYSVLHLDAAGGLARIDLSSTDKYRLKLGLGQISPHIQKGFLAYEDKHFYRHPGVNPVALLRALRVNARHGEVRMGGSTLSMQVAKLMEPKPRTLIAKAREVFRALQLEQAYSKTALLEIYLNSVPMGGNIEGVGAAAYLYFGKSPADVSPAEAALLIGLPKSPALYRPDRRPRAARAQRAKVLARVAPALGLDGAALASALKAPLPAGRFPNPRRLPHLVERARAFGAGPVRRYSLDPALQLFCESRLAHASRALRRFGVHNGALIIVHNPTRRVLAYVGSPDFDDAVHAGQVNGAAALRSPGSLLKPFLYARALEEGQLTPRRLVYDVERSYDGYEPANFERRYWGPLPAEEALALSLNIPAVDLEWRLGSRGLAGLLGKSGLFGRRLAETNAGLSITLGALPMSLEELTTLYAALADGGSLRPLVFFADEKPVTGRPWLSPEAAYITAQMLARLFRPDLPQAWEFTSNRGRYAYKTGTSFGLRDAWSLGFTPDYTVGVWFGNVDAQGSSALVGSRAAAPLVAEVMNELTRYRDVWFSRPPGVAPREVCAQSGEPAGPHCPKTLTDLSITGRSHTSPCALHRAVSLDKKTGREVCRACMTAPRAAYVQRVLEVWPPEVAAFLRAQGKSPPAPAHEPACPALAHEGGPRIRSPRAGGEYRVTEALAAEHQRIPLEAAGRDGTLYWYLDGVLLGAGLSDGVLYAAPRPGRHQVSVVDHRGRMDRVEFLVRP